MQEVFGLKVKITNAPVSFWYADKLEETFEVEEHEIVKGSFTLRVVGSENQCIFHEDCEILDLIHQ